MVIIMKIHMLKDREKAMRGTALVLAAALVFTSIDLTVFATNGEKNKNTRSDHRLCGVGQVGCGAAIAGWCTGK